MTYLLEAIALGVSLFALVVSVKAWHKSRTIYGLETMILRQVRGRSDDKVIAENLKNINSKLIGGKYSILQIIAREADGDFQVILGKIKK